MITYNEKKIVELLGEVWNQYLKIPVEHPMEKAEFCTAIHVCQNIILSRSTLREILRDPLCHKSPSVTDPLMHAVPEDPSFPDGPYVAEPVVGINRDLLAAIDSLNGRKVTCNGLFRTAYLRDGTMEELREVGAILRHRGYRKIRSGGKDYYHL